MKEPFDHATARAYVRAIIDGKGMTVFTRAAKTAMRDDNMMTGDVVNVLRGGKIAASEHAGGRWRYRSATNRMGVEFEFRGHEGEAGRTAPNEVAVLDAWREKP